MGAEDDNLRMARPDDVRRPSENRTSPKTGRASCAMINEWAWSSSCCSARMRRPRRRQPGQFLDITVRCHHGRFRFLPAKERNDVIGFWLAKAQKKCPSIQVLCLAQMSNHLHLVIFDRDGEA